jgi:transposase
MRFKRRNPCLLIVRQIGCDVGNVYYRLACMFWEDVPIKSVEQQSALMLHRTRDLLSRQRTQLINAHRAHLAELGLAGAKGREGLQQLVTAVKDSSDEWLPSNARFACQAIVAQLHSVQTQINGLDKRITQAYRTANGSMPFQDLA